MKKTLFAVLLACLCSSAALAYDNQIVHRRMTLEAFILANAERDFLADLGLTDMQMLAPGRTARDCIIEGAFAEDLDFKVIHHFLDPVNLRPLTVFPASLDPDDKTCFPSLEFSNTARVWALSASDNPFNLLRAKESLWGLYLLPKPQDRTADAAALFTDLGHVLHLIQDMAQPQHVRNDVHLTAGDAGFPEIPSYTWSRYEMWCQLNTTDSAFYQGYPRVDLPDASDYWSSGDGRGLAQYSNRNFVTEHTNYSDKMCAPFDYTAPALGAAAPRDETHIITTTSWNPETATMTVTDTIYEDTVYTFATFDRYTGQFTPNEHHTYHSYFDWELKAKNKERLYSLPQAALARQAEILMPRAVGYSQGFLQHFFRGKVDASWKKNSDGTYDLTIFNLSEEPIENAKVEVSYRVPVGTHTAGPDEDLVPIELPLALSASVDIPVGGSWKIYGITNMRGLASNESLTTFEKRIVLTGFLGDEQSAVIGLIQPPGNPTDVRVVLTWDTNQPFQLKVQVHPDRNEFMPCIRDLMPCALAYKSSRETFVLNQIQNATIIPPPSVGMGPIVFHMNPVDIKKPLQLYINFIFHEYPFPTPYIPANVKMEVFEDDRLIRTFETLVTNPFLTQYAGSYP